MAQDDYYYEIQLTNKQLVFYFMAGAAGLVLSFLAGVMVGRGVDTSASADARGLRPIQEDRVVAEEPSTTRPAPPAVEELTYAQRLEGEKVEDTLAPVPSEPAKPELPKPGREKPGRARREAREAAKGAAPPTTTAPASPPPATAAPAPAKVEPKSAPKPVAPAAGAFTIQVGAFKDRASAESVVSRLKGKGYEAYVVAPEGADGGLFNVRVGNYPARADAERIQAKLRDEEKFKPFIVRQ